MENRKPEAALSHAAPVSAVTVRRRLLVGASVLALGFAFDAIMTPRPAWAVICANDGAGGAVGFDGLSVQTAKPAATQATSDDQNGATDDNAKP